MCVSKKIFLFGAVLALLIQSQTSVYAGDTDPVPPSGEYFPGRVVVRFRTGMHTAALSLSFLPFNIRAEPIRALGAYRLSVAPGQELTVLQKLRQNPLVEYAQVERVLRIDDRVPNDTFYPSQWNLSMINAPKAWDITLGRSDIVIAIADTGINLDHPDLRGKLWINPREIPNNGIDDDGNGYIDDVYGWNFVGNNNNPRDDHGHGSHVSGIVAASTDNGIGTAGLAWAARVMAVKVGDAQGQISDADAAQGIRYAADNGAKIINLSFGGTGTALDFAILQEAITYAHDKGSLIVASAGNCGDPATYQQQGCTELSPSIYPAAGQNVVAVGATDKDNKRASFSEFGPYVDLTAPGVEIYSAWLNSSYASARGTSQAAPHVAALAALVWTVNPTLKADEVESIMESSALDLGTSGRDDQFGYGRIDAYRALKATPPFFLLSSSSLTFMTEISTTNALSRTLRISTSDANLRWSAVVTPTTSWLSIQPSLGTASGTTPAFLTVSANGGQLPLGQYSTSIAITTTTAPDSRPSQQVVPVKLVIASQIFRAYLPLLNKGAVGSW